jgi:hypothetical protein
MYVPATHTRCDALLYVHGFVGQRFNNLQTVHAWQRLTWQVSQSQERQHKNLLAQPKQE